MLAALLHGGWLAKVSLAQAAGGDKPIQGRPSQRLQREMQIHRVPELGLEIWVENQPPWEAELTPGNPRPMFVAQSPTDYYPPAVMSYGAFRGESVDASQLALTATTAIRRAAENYKVPATQRLALKPRATRYGDLVGYEADFDGNANGERVQVKVFVGHVPGRFPVAMQVYTLPGKLPHLSEAIRRSWTNLKYLDSDTRLR